MLPENTTSKEEIFKMMNSPLIVNFAQNMKRFIYTYRTWDTSTKKLFLEEYCRRNFRTTSLITALNGAKFAGDLVGIELTKTQKWILSETDASMLEIIMEEKDEELLMRWVRLFLLRPETRDVHARDLKILLDEKSAAWELVKDVITTGPYKPKTFLENVGDWFNSLV